MKIESNVLDVLARCRVTGSAVYICDTAGRAFGEPGAIPLDRKLDEATNKVLDLLGGKWNKKAKAHLFEDEPADRLENAIITADVLDTRKLFQFFPTPPDLCARMVKLADIGPGERVLEPSAGMGNILDACFHLNGEGWNGKPSAGQTVAVELNPKMVDALRERYPLMDVKHADFLNLSAADLGGPFDVCAMNPPFTREQDIAHIKHAITMLKPGGRLVAICANGPRQSEKLKPLILGAGGTWEPLAAGTFTESGTGVNTVLLTLTK